jgi:hypothetical protein
MPTHRDSGWTLLRTTETEITAANGETLEFRFELFGRDVERHDAESGALRRFRVRAFRYDTFRIQPLPPGSQEQQFADYALLVADSTFDGTVITAESIDEAMSKVLSQVERQLSLE